MQIINEHLKGIGLPAFFIGFMLGLLTGAFI